MGLAAELAAVAAFGRTTVQIPALHGA